MSESLKHKTIRGMAWSSVDKILTTAISFVLGILIARILSPEDYGIIGVLMVFVTFSNIFIDGGLSVALIQKSNCKAEDYDTAFLYNFGVSIVLYILLFFASPFIASFYEKSIISPLLRVVSICLIISAFSSIQITRLQKNVDFKKISISSVASNFLSGIAGLVAAKIGMAVWSLVIQQIVLNVVKTIILICITSWHPQLRFSKDSFKELFSFGSRLIASSILARIYDNLYPLIIGKLYPMSALGNYSRGQHFAQMPVGILQDIFQRVSFPVMSSIKKDKERLAKIYRLYIEMSSAVMFPIMFILILIAKPLVTVLLTEKWLDVVPFMQILCIGYMFNHISAINLNMLYVEGRSDWALKLEFIKKGVAISILLISILGGIWGICIGQALYSIVATILNSFYTKRLIGISYIEQLKDYGKVLVYAFVPFILLFMTLSGFNNCIIQMLLMILFYVSLYSSINIVLKTNFYLYSKEIIGKFYKK